jgi:16S rRNA (guanine527-N7)-methyltransferase
MLSPEKISGLLKPFCPGLSPGQTEQLSKYLDLLLRWNKTINLTSVTKPEEIVQRHFGESFFLAKAFEPAGKLLDIGTGAGFPGLALKILYPDLSVTLLEPVTKKRAFLKEAARECSISGVQVLPDRIEAFAEGSGQPAFETITTRAVGGFDVLIPAAVSCLKLTGRLALWLGAEQMIPARESGAALEWSDPLAIPLSNQRVILVGRRL